MTWVSSRDMTKRYFERSSIRIPIRASFKIHTVQIHCDADTNRVLTHHGYQRVLSCPLFCSPCLRHTYICYHGGRMGWAIAQYT